VAVADQQFVVLELLPTTDQPTVSEARATTLARSYLAKSADAAGVSARYGLLTIQSGDGTVALGTSARAAWVVTLRGVPYVPASLATSDCSCVGYLMHPNTAIVLDARTGALITALGIEN
jgi:hypothetical protein